MTLVLYQHPLASFCHKVLIALYESGIPFDNRIVDLGNEASRAELSGFWPLCKIPVMRDEARKMTVPETSIMIEYAEQHYPGIARMLPSDADACLQVRLWDRVFDHYVQEPMQKIVADRMRPEGSKDPAGVAGAEKTLRTAYDMIESQLADRQWIVGNAFSMADCAAAPALFYAGTLVDFGGERPKLRAYYQRLLARPSFARVLREAMPYFKYYPFHERLAPEFRPDASSS
jgi:glutathione S-transferase